MSPQIGTATVELPFPARTTDPQTSQLAAIGDRNTLRRQVWEALYLNPEGMTDWELCRYLDLPDRRKPSVAKRRQECGAIDTGKRRTSPDGRAVIAWRLP